MKGFHSKMKYRIEIDAFQLSPALAAELKKPEGSILVSFPGGYQQVFPAEVMVGILESPPPPPPPARARQQALPDDLPADYDPSEDTKVKVCIECGRSTDKIMPSGRCYHCATVKCPTCGAPTKRDQMMGQYCPSCLHRHESKESS